MKTFFGCILLLWMADISAQEYDRYLERVRNMTDVPHSVQTFFGMNSSTHPQALFLKRSADDNRWAWEVKQAKDGCGLMAVEQKSD